MWKSGLYRPQRLISLRRLGPALTGIHVAPDGGIEIGAMVRLAELERSPVVRAAAPVIAETLLTHSNVRVRNVATLGGNLAHADPHMDLPPVLIALGAATETAMRLPTAEAVLADRAIDDALLREAGRAAAAEAPVVADHHGSAAYKRVLIEVHLQRALRGLLDGAPR